MAEILLFIFGISFVIFITAVQTKIFYRRYLKSYKQEIYDFFTTHGLTVQDIYTPDKNDWTNSPFNKPPSFKLSLVIISINGSLVTWTDQKYKIIQTDKGQRIWLEIETTYFKKPKLTFKFGEKEKSSNSRKLQNRSVHVVTDNCPACGTRINDRDMECPECGLNFR